MRFLLSLLRPSVFFAAVDLWSVCLEAGKDRKLTQEEVTEITRKLWKLVETIRS